MRQFFINEGDPFNPREIRAATERIRALGLFSEVEVTIMQAVLVLRLLLKSR